MIKKEKNNLGFGEFNTIGESVRCRKKKIIDEQKIKSKAIIWKMFSLVSGDINSYLIGAYISMRTVNWRLTRSFLFVFKDVIVSDKSRYARIDIAKQ